MKEKDRKNFRFFPFYAMSVPVIGYLLGSFIQWSLDPSTWSQQARSVTVFCVIVAMGFLFAIKAVCEEENKYNRY